MTARSNRADVRNPVLALPSAARIADVPIEARQLLVDLLGDIARDAAARAQKAWTTHKAPMALYWKVVAVWARHLRVALRQVS